jgi:hypothetical protein
MPQATVRTHFHQPFDVHRDFLAQVAFDGTLTFNEVAEMVHFLFRKFTDFLLRVYLCPVKQ